MAWLDALKSWARALKQNVIALWIAARDRRTPLAARLAAGFAAAYALSPIDLIPDAIPVLGYLDDLLIVPLAVMLAVKLIPPLLMAEYRRAAEAVLARPRSWVGAAVILVLWCAGAAALGLWLLR